MNNWFHTEFTGHLTHRPETSLQINYREISANYTACFGMKRQ